MKYVSSLLLRCRWLNVPGAFLIALLQRTPVLRVASVAEEWVVAAPLGQVLRSAVAATASLGALHSLAGATAFSITNRAVTGTVGTAISPVAFTVIGAQIPAGSFRISGTLPPGVTIAGLGTNNVLNASSGLIAGTPTTAGNFTISILAYERTGAQGDSFGPTSISFAIAVGAAIAPAFTAQPAARTVNVGASVTFTAAASGSPPPAFQWRKDGADIAGSTTATLTLTNVQLAAAGAYTVVATNSAGAATSNTAVLTVTPPAIAVPGFTVQPVAQTIAAGSTVVFNAGATGATGYQWRRNGLTLDGATGAMLVLPQAAATAAGTYTVVATNSAGSATSNAAALTVNNVAASASGRLINLSILTAAGTGAKVLTVGAVVGPQEFSGTLPLVIRAVGPSLGTMFNIQGVLADPVLAVIAAGATVPLATNDDWSVGLRAAFTDVGAFQLPTASLDSAARPIVSAGGYTVQVTGKGESSGLVIAEIYDAAGAARTATTPHLINLSTLTQIDPGASLAVGFVLQGATARTVLVRGVGPSLAQLGVGGVMADPKLEFFNNDTGAILLENDNWGGDPQLATAAAAVGAFPMADTTTKDAVLLITLPPGAYSARVSSAGVAGGTAIVEVYEVP